MKTNISIGPTTLAGWGTSAIASLPLLVKLLESGANANHLGTPEQVSSLVALTSLVVTQAGRYLQAHALVKAGK